MSESPIASAVQDALSEVLQKGDSPAFLTGFLTLAAAVDDEGQSCLYVLRPPDQPTHVSLGMVTYLDEWFRDDVRFQINVLARAGEDEE